MKKYFALLLLISLVFSCKNEKSSETTTTETENIAYASFGDEIKADNALTIQQMAEKYKTLKVGDTIQAKVSASINEVCSKKGCWMKLDLGNDQEIRVTFKDYGFFMPLNAEGDVIINGKAFITETSVDDLRHYAEDAGKSKEEIDAITETERTFAFEADGVLLKQ
ncbi:DUF4920 domain-containing protein [Flavobacteriaceae bacterium S0825]|uniref:DUF4920 domain-containing protein n=1 Tax=Gaetbulibacter sp. S0825 TaxID=2720084 RepID=UPI001430F8AB|nr:DUF4920 domain-containing protein [Gaetbulibacter sp. S0825]MCK0108923.1 DUF4920 domain-containing protein [Flavobacteriaceae bacterium S0825]NIX64558.1 DUF4920 domain-containing protein [Gaetbulibacter sp. S0825]